MGRAGALLLALLALLEAHGGAAPLQPGASPALPKIYPRGSHWAVGHLMGKKSSGDFPRAFGESKKNPLPAWPADLQQLEDELRWEGTSRSLLRLREGKANRSAPFLRGGFPWYPKSSWETDATSGWKDMMDYLLRVGNMKESAPS